MAEIEQQPFVTNFELLGQLAPTATKLYDRHVQMAESKLWVPELYIPRTYGKDFDPNTYNPDAPWQNDEFPITPALQSALEVNLLTEDNLPEYYADLLMLFGLEGIWRIWARKWVSEEGQHSIVLREGLGATRLIDPIKLAKDRNQQVALGEVPQPRSTLEGFIYVTLQELATRISHRNTAKELLRQTAGVPNPLAREAVVKFADGMKKTSNDENLHYMFYRDISAEAMKIDPLSFFQGLAYVIRHFKMPGTGIRDFDARSVNIKSTGVIYDASIQYEQVMKEVAIDQWHADTFTAWNGRRKSAAKVRAIEEARNEVMHALKIQGRAAKSERAILEKHTREPQEATS